VANLTLVIATSISAVVLLLPPVYALIAYIGALVLCPFYLTTQLGTLNFPVHRIVILAVYVNIFLRTDLPNRFKFIWLDKLVIILFACQVLAGVTTTSNVMQVLENRSGRFFDMALPYFAVRLIIIDKQQYILLLKNILCIAGILAIPAFYESLTGRNPFNLLLGMSSGGLRSYRFGGRFARAGTTFGNSIQLGVFFAMAGGVCVGLLKNTRKRIWLYWLGIGLASLGVFSSMSSGALLAAQATIFFIVFYRYRRYWKQAVIMVLIMCAIVEVVSNRHFFEVADRFTFSKRNAWYRSRLIEMALFEGGMSGHWLTGYGFAEPGWGPKIDSRSYTDMVNHYLLILSRFGLVGFIPFFLMISTAIKTLFEGFWSLWSDSDRWLVWCLAACFLGALVTFNSVSIFPPCRNFFYIILGLCGALPQILYKDTGPVAL
jgi:hypothetical protein